MFVIKIYIEQVREDDVEWGFALNFSNTSDESLLFCQFSLYNVIASCVNTIIIMCFVNVLII